MFRGEVVRHMKSAHPELKELPITFDSEEPGILHLKFQKTELFQCFVMVFKFSLELILDKFERGRNEIGEAVDSEGHPLTRGHPESPSIEYLQGCAGGR